MINTDCVSVCLLSLALGAHGGLCPMIVKVPWSFYKCILGDNYRMFTTYLKLDYTKLI